MLRKEQQFGRCLKVVSRDVLSGVAEQYHPLVLQQ
jgi:hypothetical protein